MLNLVGEVIFDIIRQGKMDSLLNRNIEALTQSDRFLDGLTRRVSGCQSLITLMTVQKMRHIERIEEEPCLVQQFKKKFLKSNYQPQLAMPKAEAEVVTPQVAQHPERIWMKKVEEEVHVELRVMISGVTALALQLLWAINKGNETVSHEGAGFWEHQGSAYRKLK